MTVKDPRQAETNPARGWVALVPDDASYPYIGFDTTLTETHGTTANVTDHPVEAGSNPTDNIRPEPVVFSCSVYVTNTPVIHAGISAAEDPSNAFLNPGSTPANVPGITAVNDVSVPLPALALAKAPGAPIFTPGGAIQAAAGALGSLFGGDSTPKAIYPTLFPGGVFDAVKATHDALKEQLLGAVLQTVFTSIEEFDSMALTSIGCNRDHFGGAEFQLSFKKITTVQTSTTTAPKPSVPSGKPPVKAGEQKPDAGSGSGGKTSAAKKILNQLLGT